MSGKNYFCARNSVHRLWKRDKAGRYINPYTDYGFKYLFGTEPNKDITLALINALLQGKEVITSLTLLPPEQLGDTMEDRRSVFDVYCENEQGDKIIIEMQKADQQWFKDRSVYYSSFPIRSQGAKGRWRFGLKAVYTIGILDFVFDEDKDDKEYYHHVVKLMDINKKEVFYDKLTYIYLEMPKVSEDRGPAGDHGRQVALRPEESAPSAGASCRPAGAHLQEVLQRGRDWQPVEG